MDPTVIPSSPFDIAQPGKSTPQSVLAPEQQGEDPSFGSLMLDSAKSDWQTSWALMDSGMADADPNWDPTDEELNAFMEGLPQNYWEMAGKATSAKHLQKLKAVALEDVARQQRLSRAGWEGTTARLITGVFDPVAIGASIITDGAAAPFIYGAKIGKAAMVLRAGLAGSASNAALELTNPDPKSDMASVAAAAGFGLMFGSALGSLRKNPALVDEARQLMVIGKQMAKGQDEAGQKSAGAAQVTDQRGSLLSAAPQLDPQHAPEAAFGGARFDSVGQLGSSPSPVARLTAGHFGEEVVGYKDRSLVPQSASEWGSRRHQEDLMSMYQVLKPAWQDYGKRNGIGWIKRMNPGREMDAFMEKVSDYIEYRGADLSQFDPAVQKVGNAMRERYGHTIDEAANPGLSSGETLRSIPGAEHVNRDKHYFPAYSSPEKINHLFNTFERRHVLKFVEQAVGRALQNVDQKIIQRIADGWLTNIQRAGYGIDDPLEGALRTGNRDTIKEALDGLNIGLDDAELDVLLRAVGKTEGPDSGRLMKRTSMDRQFTMEIPAKDGSMKTIRIADFFERDAEKVFQRYSRDFSGRIALARMRVVDPSAPSTMLLDGIRNRGDFDRLLNFIKDDYNRAGISGDDKRLQGDLENLEFLYRSIAGQPHHNGEAYVTWMRRARDYNFIRLMNRMGLAQLQEAHKVVTSVGLKAAMSQMPTLRRIMKGDRSVLSDTLGRELEAMGMFRSDDFIGSSKFRVNEEMYGEKLGSTRAAKFGQKMDRALSTGKSITSNISAMKYVNSYLHQWASRSIAQRFADLANGRSSLIGKDAARMKVLGLDEAMLDKVYAQIKQHAEYKGDAKLAAMRFENWDPEVRSTFLNAIYRYSRKVIQENDAGGMARWMSKPGAQLFFQFRSFVLGAWAKTTLHTMHHLDGRALVGFLGELVMGSATYAVNTLANSTARSDSEEYLEKELSWGRLLMAGAGRASISSLMPMVTDQVTAMTPLGAVFDARTSATPTQLIGGFPVLDAFNNLQQFTRGAIDSWVSDRQMSQREINAGARTMPFGNWWPVTTALGQLVKDRPYMEPR